MKKRLTATIICFLLMIQLFTVPVFAEDEEPVITLPEVRTANEIDDLKSIYKDLFPNEFHYIEEYENNGTTDLEQDEIVMVFYGSKDLGNKTYDLLVMNNGQIFTNISEISMNTRSTLRYGKFKVGDLGHYVTFECYYRINTGYDQIVECNDVSASGGGFLLYPTNLTKKYTEDSNGPAYHAYRNVSMNLDGSGVLYDIGVAVGNDKAKGLCQISTGVDMWVWAFLYAFFF